MIQAITYKDYRLEAHPSQIRKTGEWTTDVVVIEDTKSSIHETPYSAANTWPTEQEAIQRSFELGRRIIDEQAVPKKNKIQNR